jgi:hypothetical protein
MASKGRPRLTADQRPPHIEGRPKSRATYLAHRCRCIDCTRANTDYLRDWYERRPVNEEVS